MPEFRESQFSPEQREIRQKLQQEWRMACLKGHVSLELQMVPSVYCLICERAYAYEELVDRS